MSIFSSIRRSRQHAKDTKTKAVEQQKKEAETTPYRHVPTHAAIDAAASAPPRWRSDDDRSRIVEQNRRRSAMVSASPGPGSGYGTPGGGYGGAYGGYGFPGTGYATPNSVSGGPRYINMNMNMNMSSPGMIPRVGSSLSHVSYPDGPAGDFSPPPRLPRAYSYNGVSPYHYPDHRNRDVIYSVPDVDTSGMESAQSKGKGVDVAVYEVTAPQGISPASSKDGQSPTGNGSDSGSSAEDLEMRGPPSIAIAAESSTHRLHPSHHQRRASDASVERLAASSSSNGGSVSSSRESRPPPSTRGFSAIPASAAPRPVQAGVLPGHLSPSAANHEAAQPSVAASSGMHASRQSSSASLPGLTPSSSRYASGPVTPAAVPATATTEFPMNSFSQTSSNLDLTLADAPAAASKQKEQRRAAKTTRFTELERIESSVEAAPSRLDQPAPVPPTVPEVVNVFPEPAEQPEPAPAAKRKGNRLSKGGKLTKKNRRSTAVAV